VINAKIRPIQRRGYGFRNLLEEIQVGTVTGRPSPATVPITAGLGHR
jgi:hypothetical protein